MTRGKEKMRNSRHMKNDEGHIVRVSSHFRINPRPGLEVLFQYMQDLSESVFLPLMWNVCAEVDFRCLQAYSSSLR